MSILLLLCFGCSSVLTISDGNREGFLLHQIMNRGSNSSHFHRMLSLKMKECVLLCVHTLGYAVALMMNLSSENILFKPTASVISSSECLEAVLDKDHLHNPKELSGNPKEVFCDAFILGDIQNGMG